MRQLGFKSRIFALIFIIVILCLVKVSGLGISPGLSTVQFESGLEKEIYLDLINSQHKDMDVLILAEGDLREFIELEEEFVSFSSNDDKKQIKYKLKLPEEFETPGKYTGEIIVIESVEGSEESSVGVALSVISKLEVFVPYPNKYVEFDLEIKESPEGDITRFFVPIINRGKEKVESAKVVIEIYKDDVKISTLQSNSVSLNELERKELILEWNSDVSPGKYRAVAILDYDGESSSIEKEFNVGTAILRIIQIYVKDFKLGQIAKFNAILENNWDSELRNVNFKIKVFDSEGGGLAEFKSPTSELFPVGRSEISAYWDTEKVKSGIYDAKLEVRYNEDLIERNIKIDVRENEIIISGITGQVILNGDENYLTKKSLIVIIFILLIIITILLVVLKKRRKILRKT